MTQLFKIKVLGGESEGLKILETNLWENPNFCSSSWKVKSTTKDLISLFSEKNLSVRKKSSSGSIRSSEGSHRHWWNSTPRTSQGRMKIESSVGLKRDGIRNRKSRQFDRCPSGKMKEISSSNSPNMIFNYFKIFCALLSIQMTNTYVMWKTQFKNFTSFTLFFMDL